MKKSAFIIGLVALLVGGVTVPIFAEEVPITEENVSQLQGKWEGERELTSPASARFPTSLEIVEIGDGVVKGSIIYYRSGGTQGTNVYSFVGVIEKGELCIRKSDPLRLVKLIFSVSKSRMTLAGSFSFDDGFPSRGRYFFEKK